MGVCNSKRRAARQITATMGAGGAAFFGDDQVQYANWTPGEVDFVALPGGRFRRVFCIAGNVAWRDGRAKQRWVYYPSPSAPLAGAALQLLAEGDNAASCRSPVAAELVTADFLVAVSPL